MYYHPVDSHHQHRLAADVTFLMAYSKANLKHSGDKSFPCFRPFWMGKLSDKYLPIHHCTSYKPIFETVCAISFLTILELYSEVALSWKPFGIGHIPSHVIKPELGWGCVCCYLA
jgi:hypothetical protein